MQGCKEATTCANTQPCTLATLLWLRTQQDLADTDQVSDPLEVHVFFFFRKSMCCLHVVLLN